MKLGKALMLCVSESDKKTVINKAIEICEKEGYQIWYDTYRVFKFLKWKFEYKINLYKPLDFKIEKLDKHEIY